MSTFVNSLKRLYEAGRKTLAEITALKDAGKISEEEYAYILG